MSDCSTAAMKPKEPPKTCGTCYWMMMQPGHGECGACGNPECGIERWPEAYGNGYYLYTTVDGDCEGEFWKPRTDTLEQRYQQLEQVAREMMDAYSALIIIIGSFVGPDKVTKNYKLPDAFRQQLIDCGVSLDD